MNPELIALARRLERDGLSAEARAVRALAAQYQLISLADLIALIGSVQNSPAAAARVAQIDMLMAAFDGAAARLGQPASALADELASAVTRGLTAGAEMLAVQATTPAVIAAFAVRPELAIQYTEHAAARLTRFWGAEQARLRTEVQSVLLDGLERGQSVPQISAALRDRVSVSRSRSTLIVRNELGNASAYAQRESQVAAGVTEYEWLTARDGRVRPEHKARNGKRYRWDDPPKDGHPGQPINCRCVALAVLPDEGDSP